MSLQLAPTWAVDGVALPRNPTSFSMKWDKVNATYEKQAAGNQLRISAPRLQTAIDITLAWKYAPRRVVRAITQYCNQVYPLPGKAHVLTLDGIQPAMVIECWFDTPQIDISQDNFTTRVGEGGTFQDLTITAKSDGKGLQSFNFVPTGSTATSANIASAFGGAIGNYLDYLPAWDGMSYWQKPIASSTMMTIYNLGNQEWNPSILINGPFATFGLTELSSDVDGTGQGVQFLWTGGTIASGNAILFDTFQNRCYAVVASGSTTLTTEVYTFALQTVSDGQPFSYWPGMIVGSNSFQASATGSFSAATNIDFANGGSSERFRYWG